MCAKCKVVRTFSCHLVFNVLFYKWQHCPLKGDSEATINSLSSQKYHDTLKNMFVERSTQYTSFSSRKQPANAGTERKQFTENASVALQQPILTHAHTKCPPVGYPFDRVALFFEGELVLPIFVLGSVFQ